MALVVEDGTGLEDAEAYASVSFADTYHAARGNEAWLDLVDVEKEAVLRKAADYLTSTYRLRWIGYRLTATQALDWPRANALMADAYVEEDADPIYYPSDAVPVAVQRANAELALKALTVDLSPDTSGGRLTSREKVYVIEVEYQDGDAVAPTFPAVDTMLAAYLIPTPGPFAKVRRT